MTYIKFKNYRKPIELEKAIEAYFESLKENEELANPASLRLYLGLAKSTVSAYRNNETHKEYNDLMEFAYEMIESEAWKDLQTGKGTFGTFYLARCRKYVEKQVIEQTNLNMEMSEAEKKERLKRLKGEGG